MSVDQSGDFCIYSNVATELVIDVQGYFSPSGTSSFDLAPRCFVPPLIGTTAAHAGLRRVRRAHLGLSEGCGRRRGEVGQGIIGPWETVPGARPDRPRSGVLTQALGGRGRHRERDTEARAHVVGVER